MTAQNIACASAFFAHRMIYRPNSAVIGIIGRLTKDCANFTTLPAIVFFLHALRPVQTTRILFMLFSRNTLWPE